MELCSTVSIAFFFDVDGCHTAALCELREREQVVCRGVAQSEACLVSGLVGAQRGLLTLEEELAAEFVQDGVQRMVLLCITLTVVSQQFGDGCSWGLMALLHRRTETSSDEEKTECRTWRIVLMRVRHMHNTHRVTQQEGVVLYVVMLSDAFKNR